VDADRFLPAAEAPLSKPLAGAYLTVVAVIWLSHLVGLVLLLLTGRGSWTTQDPQIVVPAFILIASAVGIVWLVDRRLHKGRPWITEGFRMLGLAYGSAVPTAWRQLRG
jgi:hypothetical protein